MYSNDVYMITFLHIFTYYSNYENVCDLMAESDDPNTEEILRMMAVGGVTEDKMCDFKPATLNVNNYPISTPPLPSLPGLGSAISVSISTPPLPSLPGLGSTISVSLPHLCQV